MADIKPIGDLGPGRNFTYKGELLSVLDIEHNKTAMRGMIVKIKAKNLRSGTIKEMSFNGDDKVELIFLDKRDMMYLYDDGSDLVFMNQETYDQVSIPKERLSWESNFLTANSVVKVTYYGEEIMGIELPVKVTLEVTETEDAVKGDTVNKAMKDAILETGYKVKVPMFVKNGTKIIVRTDTGEYDSRA